MTKHDNTISYLDVIRGVQNFTPVYNSVLYTPDYIKITNLFLTKLSFTSCYTFYFIPGVNGLAGVGCYLHPGN